MASGSCSSMSFIGIEGTSENMELMTNAEQESNLALPVPSQDQSKASYPNEEDVIEVQVSPTTLLDSNRHVCEVCHRGFPRKQNLLLHQRVHNLACNLKTRTSNEPVPKKAYLCPEPTCIHHNRSNALGDFGGLKKHYLRKHSIEKKYKCDTCSKAYGAETDLKTHSKVCARKIYICHCGTRLSRGNYIAHQENCVARTLGMKGNTITMNNNESTNTLIGPQISYIQDQSSSHPFTTPYQSQSDQFGADIGLYADLLTDKIPLNNVNQDDNNIHGQLGNIYGIGEGTNSCLEDGFMLDSSSFLSLTPTLPNLGVDEMLNPVINSSYVGSYEQGGYNSYNVGGGPLEYSGGTEMFNIQHQQNQPLHNVNLEIMNAYNNPMITNHSEVGIYEQGGYNGYNVGNGQYFDYGGGVELFNFQNQQQPLPNVNTEDMNVHGGGTQTFLDASFMVDPLSAVNLITGMHSTSQNGMVNHVTASGDTSSYAQKGYMGYDVGRRPLDNMGVIGMFKFEHH